MSEPQTPSGRALLEWDPEEDRGEEEMVRLHGNDYTESRVIVAIEREAQALVLDALEAELVREAAGNVYLDIAYVLAAIQRLRP